MSLFKNELSKRQMVSLNITKFCVEKLLKAEVYLTQTTITKKTKKVMLNSFFVTSEAKIAKDIKENEGKIHPRVESCICFIEKDRKLKISYIVISLYTDLNPDVNPFQHDMNMTYYLDDGTSYIIRDRTFIPFQQRERIPFKKELDDLILLLEN